MEDPFNPGQRITESAYISGNRIIMGFFADQYHQIMAIIVLEQSLGREMIAKATCTLKYYKAYYEGFWVIKKADFDFDRACTIPVF